MESPVENKKGLNKGMIIGGIVALLIGIGVVVSTQMGSKTPKCGDEVVKAKLLTMIKDFTMKNSSIDEATWKSMNFNIADMRTLSYDDKIDAYECAANQTMSVNGEKLSEPFTYRVSKLDNGDFYIELHGIEASAQNTPKEAPPVYNGDISHCTDDESIVFSCDTGKKIVSVCASQDIGLDSGYLQYRFGKLGSPEAIIPSVPESFRQNVTAYHLMVGGTAENKGIEFTNNNFLYGVSMIDGRLYVRQNGKELIELACKRDNYFIDNSDSFDLKSFGISVEDDESFGN